ncbi:unnamed protein product [Larinioides sclopetarius]|uniref:C2H2-type domain-containing protein n=1 Tax=Larinioides sclopetarius TaxID=280406 RepID=A0AAV2BBV7_9ARAC
MKIFCISFPGAHSSLPKNCETQDLLFCSFCDYSTLKKGYLAKHLRTHSGERPFICDLCGKSFTRKDKLKDHFVTHTNEQPYACNLCVKRFKRKESLNYHLLRIHKIF